MGPTPGGGAGVGVTHTPKHTHTFLSLPEDRLLLIDALAKNSSNINTAVLDFIFM